MCKSGDCLRTFCSGSGKLTQCSTCNTLGFQIGTAYFAVSPTELHGLKEWLLKVRQTRVQELGPSQTLFLQMHSSRILLALSATDADVLWELFEQGWQWVHGTIPPVAASMASEAVH